MDFTHPIDMPQSHSSHSSGGLRQNHLANSINILGQPPCAGGRGQTYTYQATYQSTEGYAVDWTLTGAPSGMTIDPVSGLLTWTPTAGELGSQSFTLNINDRQGDSVASRYIKSGRADRR